jgi:hypothetical protein
MAYRGPKYLKQDNLHGITLSNKQKWRLSWELFSLLFSTSLIIVIAVDLFIHRRFTWSLYPIVSLIGAWIYVTIVTFLKSKPSLLIIALTLNTLALLEAIDLIGPIAPSWFFSVGFPIIAAFGLLSAGAYLLIKRFKAKGFNIPALLLALLAFFCVIIDIIISLWLLGRIDLSWSLIVSIAVLPVIVFSLYAHYRMKKHVDMKPFFIFNPSSSEIDSGSS